MTEVKAEFRKPYNRLLGNFKLLNYIIFNINSKQFRTDSRRILVFPSTTKASYQEALAKTDGN